MADTLKITEFVHQLWDTELCDLQDLITQELCRRSQLEVYGGGEAQTRHTPLSTARVIETGAA